MTWAAHVGMLSGLNRFFNHSQGCRWRSNPGLELANAFGVSSAPPRNYFPAIDRFSAMMLVVWPWQLLNIPVQFARIKVALPHKIPYEPDVE